jgi:hypothetical protein
MKAAIFASLAGIMASAPVLAAADGPTQAVAGAPELHGMLSNGGETRFNLVVPGSGHSAWVRVGDTFGIWKVAEFLGADRTLVLRKEDGTRLLLGLVGSRVEPGDRTAGGAGYAIVIDMGGDMTVDGKAASLEQVESYLEGRAKADKDARVSIKVDPQAAFDRITTVLNLCRKVGLKYVVVKR